jgi:hypothetical protein
MDAAVKCDGFFAATLLRDDAGRSARGGRRFSRELFGGTRGFQRFCRRSSPFCGARVSI